MEYMKKMLFIVSLILLTLTACGNQRVTTDEDSKPYEKTESVVSTNDEMESSFDNSLVGKTFISGDYEYTIQENGTVFISYYTGSELELTIPVKLDNYSVTGIGEEAFRKSETLETLIIPGEIKSIGDSAFNDCSSLTSVTIEAGVESIGATAFRKCPITNLKLADSVYKLGDSAFPSECENEVNGLLYVDDFVVGFGENFDGHIMFKLHTKGIADRALRKYNSPDTYEILDKTIEFPEGILYIGKYALLGYSPNEINSYKIPSSVIEIGDYAIGSQEFSDSSKEFYDSFCDGGNYAKIYVTEGSAAEEYAKSHGLNYVITT